MARASYIYTQSALGTCGHIVWMWPQVCDIGGKNPIVVCDDCTREKYGLENGEQLAVWVAIDPKLLRKPDGSIAPKPKKPKQPKKEKPLTAWETLLRQEGLF